MAHSKYKPEYCDLLIEHMTKGNSIKSFCAKVGVSEQTFYEWCKRHPELNESKKRGLDKSQDWWEDLGKSLAQKGSAAVYIFTMKSRFGWKDQPSDESDNKEESVPLRPEDESLS